MSDILFIDELIQAHNEFRKSKRRGILIKNTNLQKACERHALYMATNNRMTHYNGSTPFTRMRDAGYRYGYAGENVAFNQQSVDQAMNAWKRSPGHLMNILLTNYKDIGAACVRSNNGQLYWCVDFGSLLIGLRAVGKLKFKTIGEELIETSSLRGTVK